MNGNITKLTELKKVRFGKKVEYKIRIEQSANSLANGRVELKYNFQSDTKVITTAPQVLSESNMQVLIFDLELPKIKEKTNAINVELTLTLNGQVSTIELESNKIIYQSDNFNVLMFADFLRAPVYLAVAQNLVETGLNVTLMLNDDSTIADYCDLSKGMPTVIVGEISRLSSSFKEIDLFVADDINIRFGPKGALRACMPHGLSGSLSAPYTKSGLQIQHLFLTADYFFQSIPEQSSYAGLIPTINTSYPLELTQLRQGHIGFVPVGYPKLNLLRCALKNTSNRKAILYAPSLRALTGFSVERVKQVCEKLLISYPDTEVIYRPYPDSVEGQDLEHVITYLRKYSNFTFDFTKSSLATMQRTKYVISDISSLAISFSLATGTPHFRLSSDDTDSDDRVIKKQGWIEINHIDSLSTCITDLEREQSYWQEQMELYERTESFPIDDVFVRISNAINNILRGEPVQQMQMIKRQFKDLSNLTPEGLIEHIKSKPFMWTEWQIRPLMISYINSRFSTEQSAIIAKLDEELAGLVPTLESTQEQLSAVGL